jgi:hypothetical protein
MSGSAFFPSVQRDDGRNEKMTAAFLRSDREIHGIAGTLNHDAGIWSTFPAPGNECELAAIHALSSRIAAKVCRER